ncbi:hypothetical protein BO78DRAFT_144378 [Aspergillus sclerotiicarbonarius CBS 121057]|uniref:Uncharacterized protein n=1 Tax=Aspergillus sclerotiicarbonarius (strain CBS 121057 / IBT 28362) TaxID=1448318 RepID=A0A319E702_ASPSB|nr:hypothetical protein BO78DRAFT_144378 [Aspergillus sclerotiicarbonarius CBS 121057]
MTSIGAFALLSTLFPSWESLPAPKGQTRRAFDAHPPSEGRHSFSSYLLRLSPTLICMNAKRRQKKKDKKKGRGIRAMAICHGRAGCCMWRRGKWRGMEEGGKGEERDQLRSILGTEGMARRRKDETNDVRVTIATLFTYRKRMMSDDLYQIHDTLAERREDSRGVPREVPPPQSDIPSPAPT